MDTLIFVEKKGIFLETYEFQVVARGCLLPQFHERNKEAYRDRFYANSTCLLTYTYLVHDFELQAEGQVPAFNL